MRPCDCGDPAIVGWGPGAVSLCEVHYIEALREARQSVDLIAAMLSETRWVPIEPRVD